MPHPTAIRLPSGEKSSRADRASRAGDRREQFPGLDGEHVDRGAGLAAVEGEPANGQFRAIRGECTAEQRPFDVWSGRDADREQGLTRDHVPDPDRFVLTHRNDAIRVRSEEHLPNECSVSTGIEGEHGALVHRRQRGQFGERTVRFELRGPGEHVLGRLGWPRGGGVAHGQISGCGDRQHGERVGSARIDSQCGVDRLDERDSRRGIVPGDRVRVRTIERQRHGSAEHQSDRDRTGEQRRGRPLRTLLRVARPTLVPALRTSPTAFAPTRGRVRFRLTIRVLSWERGHGSAPVGRDLNLVSREKAGRAIPGSL